MFTHLHTHTEYSLLDGLSRINPMLEQCINLGMDSLAITDHGAMYGVLDFYSEALEKGVKPIIGCEVYVAPGDRRGRDPTDRTPFHLTLLAKDNTGYRNLIQLVTKAHLEGFYYRPRVDRQLLEEFRKGIVVLSGCLNGEIARLIQADKMKEAKDTAFWFQEVFDDNFYLELQRHPGLAEQDLVNDSLLEINRGLGIPLVATNDFHYVSKEDAPLQDILICIHTNTTINDEKRLKMHGDSFFLKSAEEMTGLFADIPDAIINTQRISEMCEVRINFDQIHLPDYKTPEDQNPDDYLSQLCSEGLASRLSGAPARYQARLEFELEVIRQMRFTNYFLVVWDIISYARENGILYGVRGSAAASLVLYCLRVTDADPLQYNLIFERFLNVERKEMPDIDMDFQDDRRDEIIQHVVRKYGHDHVAQIITFGTMGPKAAIRDVGRALAMPYSDADKVARLIPLKTHSLEEAKQVNPELKYLYDSNNELAQLIDTAQRVEGMVRHVSTHAAGVVITQEPITEYVPLQRPARGENNETSMTQFSMAPIAKLGLLKMDFLGLANLTILKKAIELVHERHGKLFELQKIPLTDQRTFNLLSSGETADVFQLEGAGMRRYIRELKPSSLEDVAAMIALYRPGPMEHIDTYIKAKHGFSAIQYPHPSLKELLEETYGVIVYQDQVLRIAQRFAGYTLGEADIVRKAMGKKVPEIMKEERERFVSGAVKSGYSKTDAENVFDLIEPFAGYAFNKAHAISYALIAYWTAYFKANFQLEYMTAVLNIRMGHTEKITAVIEECHRLSIPVLPPDINRSQSGFCIEKVDEGKSGIRFGLAAVKNVGEQAVKPIEAARLQAGDFISIEDMCRRIEVRGLNRRMLESLIKVGTLDSLNPDRSTLLSGLDRIVSLAQKEARIRESGQTTMFDFLDEPIEEFQAPLELPTEPQMTEKEKADWERQLLGISFSGDSFRVALSSIDPGDAIISTSGIDWENCKDSLILIGQVTSVRIGSTRKGKTFADVELSLLDGKFRVFAWPNVYEKTQNYWKEGNLLKVEGKMRRDSEELEINCDTVIPFQLDGKEREITQDPSSQLQTQDEPIMGNGFVHSDSFLRLAIHETDDVQFDEARLREIIKLLLEYEGTDQVFLDMYSGGKRTLMEIPYRITRCTKLQDELERILGPQAIYSGDSSEKDFLAG